jgi:hypothetical protein
METTKTLRDVCDELNVTRKTLAKWLARLDLTPERHAYDYRYFTLTAEQVETIRSARASMPDAASAPPARVKVAPRVRTAIKTADGAVGASGMDESLSPGLVSLESFALAHGVARQTAIKGIQSGRLITASGGPWKNGRAWVTYALDADGRRQFYTLWASLPSFHRCEACPHE